MALGGADNLARSPELRTKLLWTLGLLCAYRIGVHIPVPGVDGAALAHFFETAAGTLFGLFDMFSGGGLKNVSVFALGIMPYISASIILQLLQVVSPELKRMAKEEGAAGRRKITQYTRYSTVLITIIQGFGIAVGLETMYSPGGSPVVLEPGWTFRIMTMLTLTAGTVLIMWLGEQITEKGIGNGISLIIFSGIVVGIPGALVKSFQLIKLGDMSLFIALALLILMLAVVIGVVFVERAQRRIPIQYAKRQVGRKMYGGQSTHLPLRVNTAGVIPPIFASSLLLFPATMANFEIADWLKTAASWFTPSSILYNVIFIALIFFFCFFYTAIIFDPKDVAENLKKAGGFIPGIRPGEKTQEYLDAVLSRLTLWGGVYISVISVLPMLLIAEFNVPFYFGGTSILILVGVAMDFMSQIESHLISRQYEGLMGKTRIKGAELIVKKYRGVFLKNEREIGLLREANRMVAMILDELGRQVRPGLPTMYFEEIVQKMCREFKVKPAFQGMYGFPYGLCCSVNEVIVHGFPSEDVILKEGDIVSFDVGTVYQGFYGDAARTFAVGEVSPEAARLLRVTEESLALAVAEARPGNELNDIAGAVQQHAEGAGFHVVRRFVGHGIGSTLHEKPEVPNYIVAAKPALPLKTGMVLCIEPMITVGTPEVEILEDKWSAVTRDRSLAAHFEHCVAILPGGPQILDLP